MSNGKNTPSSLDARDKAAIESAIEKVNRQLKILRAFKISVKQTDWDSSVESLQKKINTTLADSFGAGTPEYREFAVALQDFLLDKTFGDRFTDDERQQKVKDGIDLATVRVTEAKKLLTERLEGSASATPEAAPVVETKPAPPPEPAPAPAPPEPERPQAPSPTPSSSTPERIPMSTTEFPSPSSATAPGTRVAILGLGGDAVGEACEFVERLGLEAAVLDAVSIDQLEGLRNLGFVLLLPGNKPDSPAAMLAIGFMLAALGRSRIACLLSGDDTLPDVLKGATSMTVDEGGLWQLLLAREMKRAGLDVDLNRAV
jgi:hypothetical protein